MPIIPWNEVEAIYRRVALADAAACVPEPGGRRACNDAFVAGRLQEGRGIAAYLHRERTGRLGIIDIGAGNGGVR